MALGQNAYPLSTLRCRKRLYFYQQNLIEREGVDVLGIDVDVRTCEGCGAGLWPLRADAKFCSANCRARVWRQKQYSTTGHGLTSLMNRAMAGDAEARAELVTMRERLVSATL